MVAGTGTEADEASTHAPFRTAGARRAQRVGIRSHAQVTHIPTPNQTPPPNHPHASARAKRKGLARTHPLGLRRTVGCPGSRKEHAPTPQSSQLVKLLLVELF